MKNQLETIDSTKLSSTTGGALNLGSLLNTVKDHLPKPTMPLGPFYPPKPADPRIA